MIQIELVTLSSLDEIDTKLKPFIKSFDEENIFQSTAWQRSWINSLDHFPQLVIFKNKALILGYTFIGFHPLIKKLPFHQGLINQTGLQKQDQVWIEFNNIICKASDREKCIEALIVHVFAQPTHFRLTISMCDNPVDWIKVAKKLNIRANVENTLGYRLHLDRNQSNPIINKFSSNTRSQIRRTIKKTEQALGVISLTEATPAKNMTFFTALGNKHKIKWGATAEGSGFDNPYFIEHHCYLIANYPTKVSLLKVNAGNTTLGYAYYLISNATVYFYCSGLNYDINNRHVKPGYILHCLAAEHFAKQGYHTYDYMGGESRYKASLSSEIYDFQTITLFNNKPLPSLVEWLVKKIRAVKLFR